VFNIQPGIGLGGLASKEIAFNLGGVQVIFIEVGKACIEFVRKKTNIEFIRIKTIKDFIRGCT